MNIIDTDELFAINPNHKVTVIELGKGLKALEIDDFYLHPKDIEQYISSIKIPNTQCVKNTGFPDIRFEQMNFFSDEYFKKITEILHENIPYLEECTNDIMFSPNKSIVFNYSNIECNTGIQECGYLPHIDPVLYTGVVSFEENQAGTAMYKHNPSGCMFVVDDYLPKNITNSIEKYYYKYLKNSRHEHHFELSLFKEKYNAGSIDEKGNKIKNVPVLNSDENYEILHISSGRYNSVCFFPGQVPHSAFVERPVKKKRVVQVIAVR